VGRRQPSPLRKLWFSGGSETVTDETFANLAQLGPDLQLLSISFANNLGPRGMRAIAHLTGLDTLIIHEARQLLTEDFVAAGQQLRQLRRLELADCAQLYDESVDAVAVSCPRLEELGLKRLGCVEDLSGVVASTRSLRTLRLEGMRYDINGGCVFILI
jgi:hypothetical protein